MRKPRAPKAAPLQVKAGTTITNCHFIGVKWDPAALETVQTVAQALADLVTLFRSQGTNVPLIQVNGPTVKIAGDS